MKLQSLIVDILLKKIKGEKTNKDYILPISILLEEVFNVKINFLMSIKFVRKYNL